MKILNAIEDNEKDAFKLLESLNLEDATENEMRELLNHLRNQFKTRYKYLVGEWQGARRAKSTRNGQFVKGEEVVKYLKEI
ncbi:MAG: hypothetical protein GX677_05190 [Treponema sp.]|nr:hypothetical protein [Treponema sp.]